MAILGHDINVTVAYLWVLVWWFSVILYSSAAKWIPCQMEANLTLFYRSRPFSQNQNLSSLTSSSLKEEEQQPGRDPFLFGRQLFTEFSQTCGIQISLEPYEEAKSAEDLKAFMNQKSVSGNSVDLTLDITTEENLGNFQLSQPVAIVPGRLSTV